MNSMLTTQVRRRVAVFATLAASMLPGSCGSVSVPQDHWFRLEIDAPARVDVPSMVSEAGSSILRVARPELAATVAPDRLMVAEGPVRLRSYEFLRWSGSLDLMISDVFVTSYARRRAFASVKGAGEPGGEDLLLTTRVLEFHQVVEDGTWRARAVLDLRLSSPSEGTLFFHREFVADLPIEGRNPEDVVVALSKGIAEVAAASLVEAKAAGALGPAVAAGPPGR